MERLDAIVASAGGVVLLVAVLGAALSGDAATSSFSLTFSEGSPTEELLATRDPAPARAEASKTLTQTSLVRIGATVRVLAQALPPTATMHVKLTAPDGNATEREFEVAPGGGTLSGTVELDLGTLPPPRTLDVASLEEAHTALAALTTRAGIGNWTVEVAYSSGAPFDVPVGAMTISLRWTTWEGAAVAAPPPSAR